MSAIIRTRYPSEPSDFADLRDAVTKYVLAGYAPEKPFLPRNGRVITLGSCFALTIHAALHKAGISSGHVALAETVNTPPFARIMLERARGNDVSSIGHASGKMLAEENFVALRADMMKASAFILTLGVALQPFHTDGLPIFDLSRAGIKEFGKAVLSGDYWRLLRVEEIIAYIRGTIESARALRPGLPIVLTLSPIPLTNSMGHASVVGQDCISKSLIRVAIATLMDEQIPDVYYWPSFEIVRWVGGHVGPFFGTDGVDQRHVSPACIDLITSLFIEHFFEAKTASVTEDSPEIRAL